MSEAFTGNQNNETAVLPEQDFAQKLLEEQLGCGSCFNNESCPHTLEAHGDFQSPEEKKFLETLLDDRELTPEELQEYFERTNKTEKEEEPNSPLLKEQVPGGTLEGKADNGTGQENAGNKNEEGEIEFSLNRVVQGKLVYENGRYDFENSRGHRLLGNWREGAGDIAVYEAALVKVAENGYAEILIYDHEGNDVGVEWFTYDPKTESVDNGYTLSPKQVDGDEDDEGEANQDDQKKDEQERGSIEPDLGPDTTKKDDVPDLQQYQAEASAKQEEDNREEKRADEQPMPAETLPIPEPILEPVLESEVPEPVEEAGDYSYIEPEITQLEIPIVLRPELTPIVLIPHESIRVAQKPVVETIMTPTAAIIESAPVAPQMVETEIEISDEVVEQIKAEPEAKAIIHEQIQSGSTAQDQVREDSFAIKSTAEEESTAQQQKVHTLEYLSPEIYALDESGISLVDDEPTPEPPALGMSPEDNVIQTKAPELDTELDDLDTIDMVPEKIVVTEEPSVLEAPLEVVLDEPAFEAPALEISRELGHTEKPIPAVVATEAPPVQEIEEEIIVIPDNTWDILLSTLPTSPETAPMVKSQRSPEISPESVEQPSIQNISRVVEALSLFKSSQAPADTSDTADEVSTSNPSAGAAKVIERKAA